MPTSIRPEPTTLTEQALRLAWGAWTELGVSGWTRTHADWAIDPEPLILFTAGLRDIEPRLRDEATDWCTRYWRHVSRVRLRNLLREQSNETRHAFGEFAATVNELSPAKWPDSSKPRRYQPTGRSSLPPLERPALAWLRLRAMFGLGARTEILRQFLSHQTQPSSIASLADVTGYAKRNIAEECETLELAGVLAVRREANRFVYSLTREADLHSFVGALPTFTPHWPALLRVVEQFVDFDRARPRMGPDLTPVEAHRTLRAIEPDLDVLGLAVPASLEPSELGPAVDGIGQLTLTAWAQGMWPNDLTRSGQTPEER